MPNQLPTPTTIWSQWVDAVHFFLYRLSDGRSSPIIPGSKVTCTINFDCKKLCFFFHDVSCVLTLADFYWPGCAQGNIGGRSALWLLRMDWKGKILTGDVSRVPSSKFVKKATICWITVCLFFIPVRIIFNGPPLLRTLSVLLICILICERRVLTAGIQLEVVSFLKTSECLPHRCYVSRFLPIGRVKLRGRRMMKIAARPQKLQGKSLRYANTILNQFRHV